MSGHQASAARPRRRRPRAVRCGRREGAAGEAPAQKSGQSGRGGPIASAAHGGAVDPRVRPPHRHECVSEVCSDASNSLKEVLVSAVLPKIPHLQQFQKCSKSASVGS